MSGRVPRERVARRPLVAGHDDVVGVGDLDVEKALLRARGVHDQCAAASDECMSARHPLARVRGEGYEPLRPKRRQAERRLAAVPARPRLRHVESLRFAEHPPIVVQVRSRVVDADLVVQKDRLAARLGHEAVPPVRRRGDERNPAVHPVPSEPVPRVQEMQVHRVVRAVKDGHEAQPQVADAKTHQSVELVVKHVVRVVRHEHLAQHRPAGDVVARRGEDPPLRHSPRIMREVRRPPARHSRVLGVHRRFLHGPRPGVQVVHARLLVRRQDDNVSKLPVGHLPDSERPVVSCPRPPIRGVCRRDARVLQARECVPIDSLVSLRIVLLERVLQDRAGVYPPVHFIPEADVRLPSVHRPVVQLRFRPVDAVLGLRVQQPVVNRGVVGRDGRDLLVLPPRARTFEAHELVVVPSHVLVP